LYLPAHGTPGFAIQFLVDTGADRTVLAPRDANRLARLFAIDLNALAPGAPSTGVGGQARTRLIEVTLALGTFSTGRFLLSLLRPPPGPASPIPSLLGRDILSRFALFMEERTNRLLLLEPHEADLLPL